MLLAAWLTALALPILVIDNIPKTEARAQSRVEAVTPDAVDTAPTTTVAAAPSTTAAPATTAAPTTQAPATTAPARTAAAPLATPATQPRTTTTAGPPATTQVATEPNAQEGGASWYDYNPGECAHQTIPKGTVVTVTNLANGASTTCVVTDRGPYGGGRIIDLDRSTFAQLADPSAGVIQVRITW
jgi:rare lipoprotein A (peptidoglycan hydrolase)